MAEYYSAESYSIFASIFASRLNTSTTNHHIFASPIIRLRYQSFAICLDNKSRIGTPLPRNKFVSKCSQNAPKLLRECIPPPPSF